QLHLSPDAGWIRVSISMAAHREPPRIDGRLGCLWAQSADPPDDWLGCVGWGLFSIDGALAWAGARARTVEVVAGLCKDRVADLRSVFRDRSALSILSVRIVLQHLRSLFCA